MKRHLSIIISILILASALPMQAQKPLSKYFSPYKDTTTGLYGIQYGDEVCVIPQYEETRLPYIDVPKDRHAIDKPFFTFRQGNKWGIASYYRIIVKPVHEDIALFYDNKRVYMAKENGKWGLHSFTGNAITDCKYDSIYTSLSLRYGDRDKHPLPYKNLYFLCQKDGRKLITDIAGSTVGDETLANNIFSAMQYTDQSEFNKLLHKIISIEDNHLKHDKDYINTVASITAKAFEITDYVITGEAAREMRITFIDNKPHLIRGAKAQPLDSTYTYEALRGHDINVHYKFGKDGKWGVRDILGNTIIQPRYDAIVLSPYGFNVRLDDKWGFIYLDGTVKIPVKYLSISKDESIWTAYLTPKDKKPDYYAINGTYIGNTKKELKQAENRVLLTTEESNSLIAKEKAIDEKFKQTAPEGIASYLNADEYWCILPTGLDLGVLAYNDIRSQLERNPNSLVANIENLISKATGNEILDVLTKARILVEQMGYKGSDYAKDLEQRYRFESTYIAKQEQKRREQERIDRINAQIDAISGALLSGVNTAMNTYTAVTGASGANTSTTAGTTKQSKHNTGKNNPSNSLSQNHAYNTDKRTYAQYDSLLSAYFAGNRSASYQEVKRWKESMKQLRTKWERQGKDFPHSSNEER